MSYTTIELKPCPFCGSPARIIERKYLSAYDIKCTICNSKTDQWFDTPEDAAEFWNRRAYDDNSDHL